MKLSIFYYIAGNKILYAKAEAFIPLNVQANQTLINPEALAGDVGVSVFSLLRMVEAPSLEESEKYAKDYTCDAISCRLIGRSMSIDQFVYEARTNLEYILLLL